MFAPLIPLLGDHSEASELDEPVKKPKTSDESKSETPKPSPAPEKPRPSPSAKPGKDIVEPEAVEARTSSKRKRIIVDDDEEPPVDLCLLTSF